MPFFFFFQLKLSTIFTSPSGKLDIEITEDNFIIKSVNNDETEVLFENQFFKTVMDCSWFILNDVLVI